MQCILNDIHEQYASHWQAHERNMQQVQTQAETQIQSLMTSIVGKYMKLNELKSHSTLPATTTNSETATTMFTANSPSITLSELALAGTAGGIGTTKNEKKTSELKLGYMKPLYIDTGDNENKHYSLLHRHMEDAKQTGHLLRVAEQASLRPAVDTQSRVYANADLTGNKTTDSSDELRNNEDANPQRVCTKEDLKEFWRHKLLQPNPLETVRKEQESISRNQY